jgi:hypothetical protein
MTWPPNTDPRLLHWPGITIHVISVDVLVGVLSVELLVFECGMAGP